MFQDIKRICQSPTEEEVIIVVVVEYGEQAEIAHHLRRQELADKTLIFKIAPYALGFAMFQDIKRICQSPTEEDRYWFPDIAGSDWCGCAETPA
jgi:spore cortex formation protein SpoVR/YcgB (stage V sporulation)